MSDQIFGRTDRFLVESEQLFRETVHLSEWTVQLLLMTDHFVLGTVRS